MKSVPFYQKTVIALALGIASAKAGIVSVTETNIAPDGAAVIGFQFDEDALSYHDRAHQHNGVAFDEFTGLPNAAGTTIVGLPEYLIGGDYVLFDNDARDNADYTALVTTDTASTFYVLIDTRTNGLNFTVGKTNTTDPVLGGSLQWVIDGGWERMNTGISPNGQADFTGIDEAGDGMGAGMAINNFMAVYRFPSIATSVTVGNGRYPGNMISVVAVPTAPPPVPIVSYAASAISLPPGGSAQLTWLISPEATSASIDQGIDNILPLTDGNGSGTVSVSPMVNTTYTLTVGTSGGPATAAVTVSVRPLATFTSNRQRIDPGKVSP